VATDVLLLAQVPPPASESVIAVPAQTTPGPEMDDGNGFTVNKTDVLQPVGKV
jgi:hypothetical protein